MPRLNSIRLLLACLVLLVPATPLSAEDYPSKPIRILAGAAPGGLIDLFARTFAQRLQERSGQPVVVENNSVATGTIGADLVAKSPPDGYTLLLGHPANVTIWPLINPKLPYNPGRDFAPVALVGQAANLLLVSKNSPIYSVQELIATAKAQPGTLTYASQGVGSSAHMATEQFKLAAGIDLIHVPYRGSTPAMTDLIGGQVSLIIDTVPFNLAQVRAGALRALAVAADTRAPVLPDVPTMAEAGVPGIVVRDWQGVLAPRGTPKQVIDKLHDEITRILRHPDDRDRLAGMGLEIIASTPEEFRSAVISEIQRWAKVVKAANIKAE